MNPSELIAGVIAGKEEAVKQFHSLYLNAIYAFVFYRVGKSRETTEEIVQDVFIKAIRNMGKFEGRSSVYSWLRKIAVNCVTDFYRHNRNRSLLEITLSQFDSKYENLLDVMERELLPDRTCRDRDIQDLVNATLATIRPEYSSVLKMKYYEGLSIKEIADVLNKNAKAVESLLFRAKEIFRETFQLMLTEAVNG